MKTQAMKINKKDWLDAMNSIATKGVSRFSFLNSLTGSMCSIGHMLDVKNVSAAVRGIEMANAMGFSFLELTDFNDDPKTTPEDVQTFFGFGAAGAFKDLCPVPGS